MGLLNPSTWLSRSKKIKNSSALSTDNPAYSDLNERWRRENPIRDYGEDRGSYPAAYPRPSSRSQSSSTWQSSRRPSRHDLYDLDSDDEDDEDDDEEEEEEGNDYGQEYLGNYRSRPRSLRRVPSTNSRDSTPHSSSSRSRESFGASPYDSKNVSRSISPSQSFSRPSGFRDLRPTRYSTGARNTSPNPVHRSSSPGRYQSGPSPDWSGSANRYSESYSNDEDGDDYVRYVGDRTRLDGDGWPISSDTESYMSGARRPRDAPCTSRKRLSPPERNHHPPRYRYDDHHIESNIFGSSDPRSSFTRFSESDLDEGYSGDDSEDRKRSRQARPTMRKMPYKFDTPKLPSCIFTGVDDFEDETYMSDDSDGAADLEAVNSISLSSARPTVPSLGSYQDTITGYTGYDETAYTSSLDYSPPTSPLYHAWEQVGQRSVITPSRLRPAPARSILRETNPSSSTAAPYPLPAWKRPLTVEFRETPEQNYWKKDPLSMDDDYGKAWSSSKLSGFDDIVSRMLTGKGHRLKHDSVDAAFAPVTEKTTSELFPTIYKASTVGLDTNTEFAKYHSEMSDMKSKGYVRTCDLDSEGYDLVSHRGNLSFFDTDKYQKKNAALDVARLWLDDKTVLCDTVTDRRRYLDTGKGIDDDKRSLLKSFVTDRDKVSERDYSTGKYMPDQDMSDAATEARRERVKQMFEDKIYGRMDDWEKTVGGTQRPTQSSAFDIQTSMWSSAYTAAVKEAQEYQKKGLPVDKIEENFAKNMRKKVKSLHHSKYYSEAEWSTAFPLLSKYSSWEEAGSDSGWTKATGETELQRAWRRENGKASSAGALRVSTNNPLHLTGRRSEWSDQIKSAFTSDNKQKSEMIERAIRKKAERDAEKAATEAGESDSSSGSASTAAS